MTIESSMEKVKTSAIQNAEITIPFNKPYLTGNEQVYIEKALKQGQLSGNGPFTRMCQAWLESTIGARKAFLTHSGTAALEMAGLLANLKPGDEVIVPSFTFVTTASAFVLRGATPVFVDIRPDTFNLDETLIESAISDRTRAIIPVHYAGASCEMDEICQIANRHNLLIIEDAAHALLSTYKEQPVGKRGDMSIFSFHETKNISCGEGGALLINNSDYVDKAHIVWEKGTNRQDFYLGKTDKYTWQDLGSSFPPSEISAAYLYAQMEKAHEITQTRISVWETYNEAFEQLEERGLAERPRPFHAGNRNGHIYYLLLPTEEIRNRLLSHLNAAGIVAVFHYVPLHLAPAGVKYGRSKGDLPVTADISGRLLRLPLWAGLSRSQIEQIVETVYTFFRTKV